jgi:hypothetical protein
MTGNVFADKLIRLDIRLRRTRKHKANIDRGGISEMILGADITAGTVYMSMTINYHRSFPEKPLQNNNL